MSARGLHEVQTVADQAVRNMNLPRNASKGGLTLRQLFNGLLVECWELWRAIRGLQRARRQIAGRRMFSVEERALVDLDKARLAVKHEAGDVVAYAAMIVDRI